jgi:hypothetical protein
MQALTGMNSAGPPDIIRVKAYKYICDISCNSYLGYNYCNYVDCSWSRNDYNQIVSTCDAKSAQRTVTYILKNPMNTCIQNPNTIPPSSISISCDYTPSTYALGIGCYILAIIGMLFAVGLLILAIVMRYDKRMARSHLVFIYLILTGSFLLNASIIPMVGNNTPASCITYPWMYFIALTFLYGPITMKLYNVDRLNKNPKLGKVLVTDKRVIQELSVLLSIDIILLIIYMVVDKPTAITRMVQYPGVYSSVSDVVCNYSINQNAYLVLIAIKAVMFILGMTKAISTWHVTADISESKQFAVGISVGGIAFLTGEFLDFTAGSSVIIKAVTTFVCATASVSLIMLPKFIVIERKKNKRISVDDTDDHNKPEPRSNGGTNSTSNNSISTNDIPTTALNNNNNVTKLRKKIVVAPSPSEFTNPEVIDIQNA